MYAATVGDVDGVRLFGPETVAAVSRSQTGDARPLGTPEVLEQTAVRYSLGFWVQSPMGRMLGPRSFGHPGFGGSLGFGDPDAGVGFGYVPNRMASDFLRNSTRLTAAAAACLGR
jgi:CubicO group peptidase (beta-lactamase class C family)